ncbi:MAG: aromatic ring-hydroxylating dioxygenase subunit alpha, partial [Paracoccaceae bacterium]|nr:aromatic ring-hydroxylating dioxygenase subunit alpha [Paracoccaceae bacterium]
MTEHRHPKSPLLDNCPLGLEAQAYYDAEWYHREQQAIWANNWVYVGRVNDLPRATMRRISVAGENLILCKDGKGKITAFHNTCRHRGSELCIKNEQPLGKLITCPYHAWSYDTDGNLISLAHATPTEDFRKSDHGLYGAQTRIWNGFLFVCLANEPRDLTPDLGLNALANWPMDSLITGHTLVKDIDCNWKIFWENYNECLHCPGIHPELCDMVPIYRKGIMSAQESQGWTPDTPNPPALKEGARSWTM